MIDLSNSQNPTPQPEFVAKPIENTESLIKHKNKLPFFIVGMFFFLCLVLIFTINYFNIFSLSQKYPDTFYFLPHQTFPNQKSINSETLYNNLKEDENWAILAEFFKVENNTIFIKYDDKIPSLLLTNNIICKQGNKKIPTETGSQITSVTIPCSDIITNKNKGKKIIVDYNLDDNGNFIIKRLELE